MNESTGMFVVFDGTEMIAASPDREGLVRPRKLHEARVQEFRLPRPFWRVVWNPPGINPKWIDPVYWQRIRRRMQESTR